MDADARTAPVRLTHGDRSAEHRALPVVPRGVAEALDAVRRWPSDLRPGRGSTLDLWELLATLAAGDLAVARAVEPHLDALAILEQAGLASVLGAPAESRTWGVFAAEGPSATLRAHPRGSGTAGADWSLSGDKPWCSLAGALDAALVTAALPDGSRGLFAVDLGAPGVRQHDERWVSRGLAEIPSVGISLLEVPAQPVGGPGWYLDRPGFAWGGIGVAACWYGGAVGVARTVRRAVVDRSDQDLLMMHLGHLDERLHAARAALVHAADVVDGRLEADPRLTARQVRAVVARACEDVLRTAAHALGPAPLALDEDHAKRVADLEVYVRQHHAERDLASLGRAVAALDAPPW